MGDKSQIEWTDATWNPSTGCTKISQGCKFCYAEVMALRLQSMGQGNYSDGFKFTTHEHMLKVPLKWKKPRKIFVNSMSDLFHEDMPVEFIRQVFDTMNQASWHQYQVLTKRSHRLIELKDELDWQPHIWVGVSVEDKENAYRIEGLREVPAEVRFLSIEPLIEEIPTDFLDLTGIGWVIVGGESGRAPRPMNVKWVRTIRDHCVANEVPFFFKQWGGRNKKKAGRELDGRTWDEQPLDRSIYFEGERISKGKHDTLLLKYAN